MLIFIFAILSLCYVFYDFPYIIISDEKVYKQLAYEIWYGQVTSTFHYPLVYPLSIATSFIFGKYFWLACYIINVVIKTIALLVIYKLLLHILNDRISLLVCFLIGFSPIYFIYSRLIMAENIFVPLLIINILFHIVYDSEKKREYLLTIVAAILTLCLYETKYLALILIPIFFLYWCSSCIIGVDKSNYCDRIVKLFKKSILYLGTIFILLLIYAFYYSFRSQQSMSIKILKETMGLYSGGSAPGNVGYHLIPDVKWIICYSLYAILGIAPVLTAIIKRTDTIKKSCQIKKITYFLLIICAGLIYIAARHSTFVEYNANGEMKKLLGRYVSSITPVFSVLFGIVYKKTINRGNSILRIVGGGFLCLIVIAGYWILYTGGIWKPDKKWLSGLRGIENSAFLVIPVIYVVILCIAIIISLFSNQMKTCAVVACMCYCINAVSAAHIINSSMEMGKASAMYEFIYQNSEKRNILCMNYDNYVDVLQYNAFYRYNTDRCITTSPVYGQHEIQLEDDRRWIFALEKNRIDVDILNSRKIGFTEYPEFNLLFVEWIDNLFQENKDALLIKENKELSFEFEHTPESMLFVKLEGEILIPVNEVSQGCYLFNVSKEYKGDIYVYDLTQLTYRQAKEK